MFGYEMSRAAAADLEQHQHLLAQAKNRAKH